MDRATHSLSIAEIPRSVQLIDMPQDPQVVGSGMTDFSTSNAKTGTAAVVAEVGHRRTFIDGMRTCLLTDALVERAPDRRSSWSYGSLSGPERVPSKIISLRPKIRDFIRALFRWTWADLRDAGDLWLLISRYPKLARGIPGFPCFGLFIIPRWFWCAYSFTVIKISAKPAEEFANHFDSLYVVCFYTTRSLALVRAFRTAGKPVCDVQHGLVGPSHPAYFNKRFWGRQSRFQPTEFLVWNTTSQLFLTNSTGCPAFVRDFDDSRYVSPVVSRTKRIRPHILVTLQWSSELPVELITFVLSATWVNWVLRLHPRDPVPPSRRLDCIALSRAEHVQIELPSAPLILSLRTCDLHITESSSVVIEASAAKIRSLFWDTSTTGLFLDEIGTGLAECIPIEKLSKRILELLRDDYDGSDSW